MKLDLKHIVISGLLGLNLMRPCLADDLDLTALSIEELMNIEINLASRKAEKIRDVAAAAYVLTHEDIVNSGFTSLPEVLRLVPGMEVGRFDANKWAITSRGYNNLYANKLLVLIDGRSVYNVLFSGVFWELQHIPLMDVERIEVIRGPGGTLWGANAVNGIINIITKKSQDTQGGYVEARGGGEEEAAGTIRWGGQLTPSLSYRAWFKGFQVRRSELPSGENAADDWKMSRAGFRMDWQRDNQTWALHGDCYAGRIGQTLRLEGDGLVVRQGYQNEVYGGNVVTEYQHQLARDQEFLVRSYLDFFRRKDLDLIGGGYSILDLDMQYRVPWKIHQFVTGEGFRITRDFYNNSDFIQFIPSKMTHRLISFFVHDEIQLLREKLQLKIGSKFEHDNFSGLHVQPNARILLKVNSQTRLWGALSRAVRSPARSDMHLQSVLYHGNPDFRAEELIAGEIGLRRQVTDDLSFDLSAYYHDYDNLNTVELEMSDNKKEGLFRGVELSADCFVTRRLKIRSGYTYLNIHLMPDADSQDKRGKEIEEESPNHQAFLSASWNMFESLMIHSNIKYVDALAAPQVQADAYMSLNAAVHWQAMSWLKMSVVGQNLLQDMHEEFPARWAPFESTGIQRSVYGQAVISW